jgi:hypothetical protein
MFKNNKMYGNQLKYLEQVRKELEARKSKVASISYRKKLKQQQDKENYLTELHRIRGALSQADNRFPITKERLKSREEELKKIIHNNAFPNEYKYN